MTDSVSTARSARENLARGLAALQSPGVPPAVMDVAEPVAEAMSALHRIESTQGGALGDAAPAALQSVRRALGMLQAQPGGVAAVEQAMEAIAGSLSLVHILNQALVAQPAQQPAAAAAGLGGTVMLNDAPAAQPQPGFAPQQPAYAPPQNPAPAFAAPAPQPAFAPPAAAAPNPAPYAAPAAPAPVPAWPGAQPQPQPQAPPQAAYPQQQPPWGAQPQPPAGSAPQQPLPQQPLPQPHFQQPQAAPAVQQAPSAPHHAPPAAPAAPLNVPSGALRVEAELGAHSATNFYKGLSGNDVIDSGGIFVATYNIPNIGQNVLIKVSLPGGYEFEALGVVQWTRDAPHSTAGNEVPPGFGARFTQISPEGRQLVYRYVRNREPLFHDDL